MRSWDGTVPDPRVTRGIAASIEHDHPFSKRSGGPSLEYRIPYSEDAVVMILTEDSIENNGLLNGSLFEEGSVGNGYESVVLEREPARIKELCDRTFSLWVLEEKREDAERRIVRA
jgi:hypothetical protein